MKKCRQFEHQDNILDADSRILTILELTDQESHKLLRNNIIGQPFVRTSPKVYRRRPNWLLVHSLDEQNSRCSRVRIVLQGSSPWRSRQWSECRSPPIGARGSSSRVPPESRKTRGPVQYELRSR